MLLCAGGGGGGGGNGGLVVVDDDERDDDDNVEVEDTLAAVVPNDRCRNPQWHCFLRTMRARRRVRDMMRLLCALPAMVAMTEVCFSSL